MTDANSEPPERSGPNTPDVDGLHSFTARWAREAIRTSHVPLSRSEVIKLLRTLAEDMATALRTEPFSADAGTRTALRLVENNFTGPDTLGCTIRLLVTDFLAVAGLDQSADNQAKIGHLASKLSAAYADALRERLFAEQEMMKRAVFAARDAADRLRIESEARLRAVFETSSIGIGIGDFQGRIVDTNPAMTEILGYTREQLRQMTAGQVIGKQSLQLLTEQFMLMARGVSDKFTVELEIIRADGEPAWVHLTTTLVRDADGKPAYPVAMIANESEVHLLRGSLLQVHNRDLLTGLASESKFRSQLERLLANAAPGERVALCFLDLDGFKVINDGMGRQLGDDMLKVVARTLEKVFAELEGALVARISGDGFAVLLPNPPAKVEVIRLVEAAQELLREPQYFNTDNGMAVTASVGIVDCLARETTADDLIIAAEITTHRAKTKGKAQWVFSEPAANEEYRTRFEFAAMMPGAMENGQFQVRYQPFMRLSDGCVIGVRAFPRWEHPELGIVDPDMVIEMAEETGFIVQLGQWLIDEACAQVTRWAERLELPPPIVAIALSKRSAEDPHLMTDVQTALKKYQLQPSKLHLAIPSSVLLGPHGEALESARELTNELGIRITASQVGAGDFRLADLHDLPVHAVSFGRGLSEVIGSEEDGSPMQQALSGLISLCHTAGLQVIAAQVHNSVALRRFSQMGVDIAFGDVLAPVGDPDEVELFLRSASLEGTLSTQV